MRKEEAEYIGKLCVKLVETNDGLVLNLGSSTRYFREVDQPHIHNNIFAPLAKRDVKVIHSDLKKQEGVDIAGDIFDPVIQKQFKALNPKLVLVCNLMEHLEVEVKDALPKALDKIINSEGYLIITVPNKYPLHYDPIDTYYRPSPEELSNLFPSYKIIDSGIITSTTYLSEIRQFSWQRKLKLFARFCTPFYRPRKWLGLVHALTFLFRPFKVSFVALRK
jgi:hypothetical protein